MNVKVWVLIVDAGSGELGLSVHGSYDDALQNGLRVNYALDDDVADDELIVFVESQGLVVTIEEHDLEVTA